MRASFLLPALAALVVSFQFTASLPAVIDDKYSQKEESQIFLRPKNSNALQEQHADANSAQQQQQQESKIDHALNQLNSGVEQQSALPLHSANNDKQQLFEFAEKDRKSEQDSLVVVLPKEVSLKDSLNNPAAVVAQIAQVDKTRNAIASPLTNSVQIQPHPSAVSETALPKIQHVPAAEAVVVPEIKAPVINQNQVPNQVLASAQESVQSSAVDSNHNAILNKPNENSVSVDAVKATPISSDSTTLQASSDRSSPSELQTNQEPLPQLLKSGEKSAELKSNSEHETPSTTVVVEKVSSNVAEIEATHAVPQQQAVNDNNAATNVGAQLPKQHHVVMGGLGPLNLLAETLCSSQPERLIASDELNALYAKRAALRKSLYALMSLKFTHLEKLSSRLNYASAVNTKALAAEPSVVITSPIADANLPQVVPSHGWPVVGKCTAHDLKLMAEAAWCEERTDYYPTIGVNEQAAQVSRVPRSTKVDEQPPLEAVPASSVPVVATITAIAAPDVAVETDSSKHSSNGAHRAIPLQETSTNVSNHQVTALVSKVLNISDTRVVAPTSAEENKSRECRRKALRLSKALFNHLAENQATPSESWPQLYAALYEDECARRRVVDIVSALSNFRGESSSTIRRDNVEFAFAMDDLRPKVLESEVSAPLTFDRQFIEAEQFLQQSVKLLMANIDPERAKLTQLRFRSLMSGPASPDDQCVELHQRLLAKNYPSDCNPNQFGQLTDVLRMTAMSLDLWSVEADLVDAHLRNPLPPTHKLISLPDESIASKPVSPEALRDCISYLVAS